MIITEIQTSIQRSSSGLLTISLPACRGAPQLTKPKHPLAVAESDLMAEGDEIILQLKLYHIYIIYYLYVL